jgi:hypothetical protein
VAGSMEKPNSAFKKKEALEVGQVLGQFAQAAPGAVLRVLLRLYSQAFTDVIIKPEDWAALDQEIAANLQRGVSTAAAPQGGTGPGQTGMSSQPQSGMQQGAALPQQGSAVQQDQQAQIQILELAKQLPPGIQNQIVQMSESGVPAQEIMSFIQQQVTQLMGSASQQPQGAQPQMAQAQGAPAPTQANGAGNAAY